MDQIRESSIIQYFKQEGREEGFEQGREEGIEQGREEGIEQGIQESIQEVLEIRFGLRETNPLFARIAAIDNVQYLKQLRRAAIQVSNLDEFEHMLDVTA
ncbi:MAG: hypothetical protein F4Y39_01680 [Gemmatimonadetes bacterium]|nr:hypothetical protein [Gemmatimonadota bacterium]MYF72910.1 hypothetical protein [Gemmatimonadota bacterium]MYK51141.1 hypothetical protein [Gemmatimonadota bacterium]